MTEPKKFSRGQDEWPDGDGDYRIVCADGRVGWICTAEFGDRTREVAEAVLDVLNGDAVVLPKLPEPWMEYRATAMGSALREHDPNGDACKRLNIEAWCSDNYNADPNRIYLIQPEERPEPPKVEPVPMAECGGRTAEGHAAPITHLRWGGSGWVANDRDGRIWPVPADGMVSVLVEADEAAER